MSKLWLGDWFILMQLCKNLHPEIFRDIVIDLRNKIDPKLADNMDDSEIKDANFTLVEHSVEQKLTLVDIA